MTLFDKCFRSPDAVIMKDVASKGVLLHLDTGSYYSLNEMGMFIYALFDGTTPLAEVAEEVCRRYDVGSEEARHDLASLVRELEGEGLLVCDENPGQH
jgi:hypothetical protein